MSSSSMALCGTTHESLSALLHANAYGLANHVVVATASRSSAQIEYTYLACWENDKLRLLISSQPIHQHWSSSDCKKLGDMHISADSPIQVILLEVIAGAMAMTAELT